VGLVCAPFIAFGAAFAINREFIIEQENEILDDDDVRSRLGRFSEFMFDKREARLKEILDHEIKAILPKQTIAIKYGAAHMIAFEKWLLENGYVESDKREVRAMAPSKKEVRKADGYGYGIAWAAFEKKRYGRSEQAPVDMEKLRDDIKTRLKGQNGLTRIKEKLNIAQNSHAEVHYYGVSIEPEAETFTDYWKPRRQGVKVTIDPLRYLSLQEVISRTKREKVKDKTVSIFPENVTYSNPESAFNCSSHRMKESPSLIIEVPPQTLGWAAPSFQNIELSNKDEITALPADDETIDDDFDPDCLSTDSFFRKAG